jgi:hypothetical protein
MVGPLVGKMVFLGRSSRRALFSSSLFPFNLAASHPTLLRTCPLPYYKLKTIIYYLFFINININYVYDDAC